ncbi:MAG: hypothetical protein M1542_08505 [Thermotogae bacterium]|jgi:hypothetical protein|nr:hypothetical protein [Thermotogota bacterium]
MFDFFTFLIAVVLLFVWVFESKATTNFRYPALFGAFLAIEFIAVPYAVMAGVYLMSFEYSSLTPYVGSYQIGLDISVLVLGVAFVAKVANKYFLSKGDSSDKKE